MPCVVGMYIRAILCVLKWYHSRKFKGLSRSLVHFDVEIKFKTKWPKYSASESIHIYVVDVDRHTPTATAAVVLCIILSRNADGPRLSVVCSTGPDQTNIDQKKTH